MIERRLLPTLDLNFLGTALVISAIGCLLIYSATYFADPHAQFQQAETMDRHRGRPRAAHHSGEF